MIFNEIGQFDPNVGYINCRDGKAGDQQRLIPR